LAEQSQTGSQTNANTTTTSMAPIPTPMKLQIRRVRYQVLPVVIFTIALVATIWLWKDYAGTPHGMGEVHAVTVRVAAPHDGHLAEMDAYPRLFDHVNAKQPLARFDASKLIDQQTKADDQKNKLQDELDAANKAVEEATKGGADKAKIESLKGTAAALKSQVNELRSKYDHLEEQIKASVIEAPVSGTITAIKGQPGEFVRQGQEIITITQDTGAYIVSYVRPGSAIVPKRDQTVVVRGADGRRSAYSRVQEVGSQIELIPEHQLSNAKRPEWGIPVRIAMPDASRLPLRPGELVVLNFKSE